MMRGLFAGLACLVSCAMAQERVPTDWSTKDGSKRNIAWTAKIGSWTIGPPVISDGLVWIGTDNREAFDPNFKQDVAVLACFRESDGTRVWSQGFSRRAEFPFEVDPDWLPLRCTPLVESDRLWVVNNRWEVLCFDIAPLKRTGAAPRELWKTDLIAQLEIRPCVLGMGFSTALSLSPSSKGHLFLATGNGINWKTNKPARPEAPALICLERETGKIVGRERSGISAGTVMANWSTPVLAKIPDGSGGQREIVVFGGGNGFLYAFDADPDSNGTLREIWKADCRRSPEDPVGIVAKPLIHAGRVYVSLGSDGDTDGDGNFSCLDLVSGRKIWNTLAFGHALSSPVVDRGRILAVQLKGIIDCFDPATGAKLWEYDALSMIVPSPVLVGGKMYVCNGDDEVLILDVGSTLGKPGVVKREMTGCGGSTPAVAGHTLFLAGRHSLLAIREGDSGPPAPESPALKRGRSTGAIFVPTPMDVARDMLNLASIRETDLVYDLGSGDGRIVIAAAQLSPCKAVGVEIDPDLVEKSREAVRSAKLEERVRIEHEDLLKVDFSAATVITLYVGDRLNRELMPKLKVLKPGVRIVSHQFRLPGVTTAGVWTGKSSEDGREHELFLYRTPLQPEAEKK